MKKILSAAEQAAESEDLMEFFNSAVDTLQTIVVGLGGGLEDCFRFTTFVVGVIFRERFIRRAG